MKQSERIIRKGDYYEMEVVEDGFYSSKISKKQESQTSLPSANQSLVTDLPQFSVARSNYYFQKPKTYANASPDLLIHELEDLLRQENIADQDKQEIIKLIRQARLLKDEPLQKLTQRSEKVKQKQKDQSFLRKIQLRARLDLKNLQQKVQILQKFAYPQIAKLEHQLEILLGEKRTNYSASLPKDDRNKEDIENLFATFNSLTCINNLPGLVSKIHANNGKYVQVANWANSIEASTTFHSDFLAQLKQDEQLLNKLELNFKQNLGKVRILIDKIKKQAKSQ